MGLEIVDMVEVAVAWRHVDDLCTGTVKHKIFRVFLNLI